MATSVKINASVPSVGDIEINADDAATATKTYWDVVNGLTTKPAVTPTPDPPVNPPAS